ncbi:MAG: hypothetical protein JWO78_2383 [Micavibrio sp.]|nr:hypothetical protein [Micavibrio sp.]
MVDAVFSSVTTSTLIRATAEQASSSRASANKVQAAPQAPFVSPYIGRDQESQKVVIQIRNGETGKVIEQIPSRPETEQQQKSTTTERVQQAQSQQQPSPAPAQQQPSGQSTPSVSSASFGAFAKQVASLQTAASTGSSVSISV